MPEPVIQPIHFAYLVSGAALFLVLHLLTRNRWERQIRRWCAGHGYQLVSWESAKFFEGPRRSDNQNTFRIEVEDRDGMLRDGYLTFASGWGLSSQRQPAKVDWD
jgi:hypothetical protein